MRLPQTTMASEVVLPNIEAIPRPEGKSEEYQFFINHDTGNRFKAKIETQATDGLKNGTSTQFTVTITTSQVDDENKALQDFETPVIDNATRVFTEADRNDPDFNALTSIKEFIVSRIVELEKRNETRGSISDIEALWRQGPLVLEPIKE